VGYRSTVAYTIRFIGESDAKAKQSFYTFLAEAKANPDTALCFSDEEKEYFSVDELTWQIKFFVDGVKWYDDYAEVKCHTALMDLSKNWTEDNDCIGGAFARVGEDSEDNTEEVWGLGDYDWVYLSRQVICDWL
jgi:hypothetical protein